MTDTLHFAKDPKGTVAALRRQRSSQRKATERRNKERVRFLDGNKSRWPTERTGTPYALGVDHHDPKGMGGDPTGAKDAIENLITLSFDSHQGPRSVHSGHKRVELLTAAGTRGPCAFWERDNELGGTGFTPWRLVAREVAIGVYEPTTNGEG